LSRTAIASSSALVYAESIENQSFRTDKKRRNLRKEALKNKNLTPTNNSRMIVLVNECLCNMEHLTS
jgi:hypothetical protein